MYLIRGHVYVEQDGVYVKCVLHSTVVNQDTTYYLVPTKVNIKELPVEYECVTFTEVIARLGPGAVVDNEPEYTFEDKKED